jgi:hypothetical protein
VTAFGQSSRPTEQKMATNILYPLASLTQIKETPSMVDGILPELEEDLRTYGCKLIQQAGLLLKQCGFLVAVWVVF